MTQSFDPYADRYEELVSRSISFSGREQRFFVEARARHLLAVVRRRLGPLDRVQALDVGCGTGIAHPYLGDLGRLEGVDLSKGMIERARAANPRVRYHVAEATRLPFTDASFDLTFTSCVLHHVPPAERPAFAAELARVTRPGGLSVVFEHNPWNPLTRLAVARCEFDEDAILLRLRETVGHLRAAGLRTVERRYIIFLPWRGRLVAAVEGALRRTPLGAQYYVAAHA